MRAGKPDQLVYWPVLSHMLDSIGWARPPSRNIWGHRPLCSYSYAHYMSFIFPQMVTSSELCTIVTTDDNSFLLWGSRPVIKTPLREILEDTQVKYAELQKCGSNDMMENTVFIDDPNSGPGTPRNARSAMSPRTSHPSGPLASNLESRKTSGGQPHFSSEGTSPKASSNDNVAKGSPSRLVNKRTLSFNFSEIPHSLVPCTECCKYLKTLNSVLSKALDASQGRSHPLKRDSTSATQTGVSHHRRGTSASNSSVHTLTSKEGILLQPTSIDLVGKSGILNLLSVEGIAEAKLEGLSCYGSNVLVLLQAQVITHTHTEEEESASEKWTGRSPTFRIGRKITQRAIWRYVNLKGNSPYVHSTTVLCDMNDCTVETFQIQPQINRQGFFVCVCVCVCVGGGGGGGGARAGICPPLSQTDLPHIQPCYPPRFLVYAVRPPCHFF